MGRACDGLTLAVSAYEVRGLHSVDLSWTGATSTAVDVYRDGALIATSANDGSYTDALEAKGGGSYGYQVCEAASTTCSAVVDALF